ncbi:adrenodoxin-like isoform X2 [Homarus americanus]|uniref:adrenodoxin-like isoform X2 n=1 Tax=Homarus americanus TaxID=6706 RepID=UPI001C478B49|nr:adrenodoxin-like isoform X2 [Homarus americanus]
MAAFSFALSRLVARNVTRVSLLRSLGVSSTQLGRMGEGSTQNLSTTSSSHSKKEWYEVTYERADGTVFTVKGKEGDNLLDIAINNDIDLEGFGACEGTLACSTCHLIFKEEDFDMIEDPCTDEELDMLDLAYGLSDTSRLGCQVCLTKKLNGIKVKVPEGTADARG